MAYSIDLRKRVLAAYQQGLGPREVARRFQVSERFVHYLIKQFRDLGHLERKRGRTGPKPKLEARRDDLRELLRKHPDLTLSALREKLGVAVCLATLWKTLGQLGWTLKKSPARRRTGPARRGAASKRVVK